MVLEQGALSGVMIQIIPCLSEVVGPKVITRTAADRKINRRHEKHGNREEASVAQIAIAWAIAKGTLPLMV